MNDNNRRNRQRFKLPSMYSRVLVRNTDSEKFEWEGHAYDISEGGICFELDRGFEPGAPIVMRIDLPQGASERSTQKRSVFVFATVVWLQDEDEPGPVRMAAVFNRFAAEGDEDLLHDRLWSGRYAIAA